MEIIEAIVAFNLQLQQESKRKLLKVKTPTSTTTVGASIMYGRQRGGLGPGQGGFPGWGLVAVHMAVAIRNLEYLLGKNSTTEMRERIFTKDQLIMTFWCLQFSKKQRKNFMNFCPRI